MKRFFSLLLISLVSMAGLTRLVNATSGSDLIISRVQLSTQSNASDEVVAIYNNSNSDLDISKVKLQYKSASGTTWTTRAQIPAPTVLHGFSEYSFATVIDANQKMSAGLAQTGGNLRLVDDSDNLLDALAWGNGDSPLGQAISAPSVGSIILRKTVPNSLNLQDTGDNAADFSLDSSNNSNGSSQTTGTGVGDASGGASDGVVLQINELLPDPVSPQTDSNDEFIELYNPMSQAVSLAGWQLKDSGGKVFNLPSQSLAPDSYAVFYSKLSHISLNNDGDTISLISPQGDQIDQSPDYGKTNPGLSWGLTEDGWAWTITPTPGSANSAAVIFPAASATTKKPTKTTKTTAKKVATKAKAAKASTSKSSNPSSTEDEAATKQVYRIWAVLLIVAGVGTIGYGIYEYRPEIKAAYLRLRSITKSRTKSRV